MQYIISNQVIFKQRVIYMKIDYTLYLVTDSELLKGRKLETIVYQAVMGGVSLVQLREKKASSLDFYMIAKKVKEVTDKFNVPLIINDRIDIALSVDAAGVHIGQEDLPCKIARQILPKDKIIGVSVHNIEEALRAQEDGADYLGCGAVFTTSTKSDVSNLTIDKLAEIKKAVNIPVVAIGGINKDNVSSLRNTKIDGIAVVSAIVGNEDPKLAAENMKSLFTLI